MRPPWAAFLELSSKAHHSFHKRADARCDADQQVGRWLVHGEHLDDAFRGLFGRSLAIEELLCAPAPIGARGTAAFDRRHGIQTDPGKRGDVSGNRQRGLKLRVASRDRCESVMIVAP